MRAVCLHDKGTIERLLRQSVYLHLYSIGDLDDFFWPYTTWYATPSDAKTAAVALLYSGQSLATLLALAARTEAMRGLLESVLDLLPPRFYAHLSPGLESVFARTHTLESHGEHLKMALLHTAEVETLHCGEVSRLQPDDLDEIVRFYARCYPGNWFDPRMLETDQYFGIREGGCLVSIAGIHVYSREYKVAALGNIATAPSQRNKGLARRVTARTCKSLLEHVSYVGLNVKADNGPAISCYRRLGFEPVASYGEYMVCQK